MARTPSAGPSVDDAAVLPNPTILRVLVVAGAPSIAINELMADPEFL